MAEYVAVEEIKESLMECPVCTEILDNDKHSPKLLTCCLHAICTQCVLGLITSGENTKLTCPMCRKVHHLPHGANDLPVERVMMKMVDFLKIVKGKYFPCTDCPDNGTAISHCNHCKAFLCQLCENAHKRNIASRDHTIVSLQVIKLTNPEDFSERHSCDQHPHLPMEFYCHPCDKVICVSCTIVDHKDHEVSKLEHAADERRKLLEDLLEQMAEKTSLLTNRATELLDMRENINKSEAAAQTHIEIHFKKLHMLIDKRKEMLMRNLKEKHKICMEAVDTCETSNTSMLSIVKSATEHTQNMMSKADCVETLDLYSATSDTLKAMIENQPDVEFTRIGIAFTPVNFRQLESFVEDAGLIRTVTFTPIEKPNNFSVEIEPPDFPQGQSCEVSVAVSDWEKTRQLTTHHDCLPGERLIVLQSGSKSVVIKCPYLEFDPVTQDKNISIHPDGVLTNKPPLHSVDDTGCQLKKLCRSVFISKTVEEPGKHVWQVQVHHKVKQKSEKNMMYFETALTNSPEDASSNQTVGVSLILATVDNPDQLYITLRYDGKVLRDIPVMKNEPGKEGHFDLLFLLDMDRKRLSFLDLSAGKVLYTVVDIDTSDPLFLMFNLAPDYAADQTVNLVSGLKIDVTGHLIELLTKVTEAYKSENLVQYSVQTMH